jgi:ferric-dicitrate binding protein FerR (iron transport regulator)
MLTRRAAFTFSWRLLLALVLLGAWLASARAQQPAAELRTVVGVVFAQSDAGALRILQAGARVAVGETVGTQKGAFAVLVFNDGSRAALRPETALRVRGFRYRPEDAREDELAVDLLQGWLRKVSGEIARRNPRSFEMRVGDATIGIRGTDFAVRICDEACVRERSEGAEGVLPQSRRLGQVVAAATPVRRQRGDTVDRADGGAMLILGDVLATDDEQALIGLDDGSRIVLAARSVLALRSVEDDLGRRAVRLDLLQGAMRVAAAPRAGARLYGLLVNAGATVGLRPGAALDAGCEAPAPAQAYACEAATVLLRQGRGDVLTDTGARALPAGQPERLVEPALSPTPAAPTSPVTSPAPVRPIAPNPAGDPAAAGEPPATPMPTSAPGLQVSAQAVLALWQGSQGGLDAIDPLDVPADDGEQVAEPPPPAPPAPPPLDPLDPLDIPIDRVRPPSVVEPPQRGVYLAVFQGLVSLSNRLGEVTVGAGEGAFAPLLPTFEPRALAASPLFMERDLELDRPRLYPESCMR